MTLLSQYATKWSVGFCRHAADRGQDAWETRPDIILCMIGDQGWCAVRYKELEWMAAFRLCFDRFDAAASASSPSTE